ncbi:MAG TPA: hypothetical protein VG269_22810 [Tepidisphaeraceae bacterium]|jgi:hypothetical protein|nr:hypothetical protein [Tepidisphaeraceae bacterium]
MNYSIRSRRFRAVASVLLGAAVCGVATPRIVAAETPANATRPDGQHAAPNAAVEYWLAFAVLPPMDERQHAILDNVAAANLDADATRLIDASANSLKQLHRGATIRECDWGLHYEDGPMLLLPHLGKARDLSRLACLRARAEFQKGDAAGAVEDLADALTLARHGGGDATLIAILVQDAIEQMAINVAAANLPGVKGTALQDFSNRLSQLPAGGSLKESAVRIERQFGLDWLINELKHVKPGENWQDRIGGIIGAGEGTPTFQELVKSGGNDVQNVIKRLEASRPYYEQIVPLFDLPPDQFHPRAEALFKQFATDAWGKMMLPDFAKVYDKHMSAEVRLAMLRAAVAVQEGGPDALKTIKDPAGGAFEHHATPGGFELQSKFAVDGKPVTLKVGPAGS